MRSITAPVGLLKGPGNLPADVTTVQELLNKVPVGEGGPSPALEVDGICGSKTKAAIQAFQLKQFGWSLADGRVDPGKQTITRLNDFDKASATLSSQFRMRRNFDTPYILNATESYFQCFEVADVVSGAAAAYYLGNKATPPGKPTNFVGMWHDFTTSVPYAVTGFECSAQYTTYYFEGLAPENILYLNLKPQQIQIKGFLTNLFLPGFGPEAKTQDLFGDFILFP